MNPLLAATFELIKSQVIKYIVSKAPIFGGTLFNPLLNLVVTHILKIAFEQTELAIYFLQTDKMTKEQAEKVKQSQDNLKKAETPEEKEKATNELKNHLRDLIRINPK